MIPVSRVVGLMVSLTDVRISGRLFFYVMYDFFFDSCGSSSGDLRAQACF